VHSDFDSLHRHIKNAYVTCSQAVNDELKRQLANDNHKVSETAVGNGRSNIGSDTNSHRASSKQREYLTQLARQIDGLGIRRLDFVANTICGKPVAELNSLDASSLIDTLKEVKAGHISLDAVFQGTATQSKN